MELHKDVVSDYRNFSLLISNSVQLQELSLFLVIIDSSHSGAEEDGDQDGKTVDPSFTFLFSWSSSYLKGDGYEGCNDQYSKGKILESVTEQLQKSGWLFDRLFVGSEVGFSFFKLDFIIGNSIFLMRASSIDNPLDTVSSLFFQELNLLGVWSLLTLGNNADQLFLFYRNLHNIF